MSSSKGQVGDDISSLLQVKAFCFITKRQPTELKNEANSEGPKSAVSQMATCFRLLQTMVLVSICIYPVNDNCVGGECLYSFLKLSIMKGVYCTL